MQGGGVFYSPLSHIISGRVEACSRNVAVGGEGEVTPPLWTGLWNGSIELAQSPHIGKEQWGWDGRGGEGATASLNYAVCDMGK